ncbi:zinc-dependent metalloprotease [Ramlibacter albus]|uniref:Zinc-dependent metalloprotease n=1 Tax=Ramlibacter albus TaxID=2079448 RepID=A0A923S2E3_9BURK|nr:zinc-dependent metalloprotease [Ramlibacter albus]MBC5764663.1 zinc-dependent metalloprotease [Ramlibacter albus]
MKPRLHPLAAALAAALIPLAAAHAETPESESPLAGIPVPPKPGQATAASTLKAPVDPAALKPFDEIVAGAKRQPGLIAVWRKDEKVWLEIPKEMVGQPFLFTANVANSVGERGLYASQMAMSQMAQFRLVGRQVQLLAINTKFRAEADQGSKRAIEQAFSPSLVASSTLASAEHPVRKSILVDASFLLSDIVGYSTNIENAYRMTFGADRTNSSFERVRAEAGLTTLTARVHFFSGRIPAASATASASPPQATPDPRSLFVDFVYSFLALPKEPMATRRTDPRLGHFSASFTDLGGDLKANPRTHYITRWRLEKKAPQAAMSEPVKPITFWMDKNIPAKYRAAVEGGILEWNKAFERIGFKGAIVAKQQPDDADWDSMDAGHASIRWFVGADVGFARGPHHHDPRTGEILDADIAMSDVFARSARRSFVEDFGRKGSTALVHDHAGAHSPYDCDDAYFSAMDADFAQQLLEARDELTPDSPEAEAFVQGAIKATIMHEVGHVLGLKHNFKGSSAYTAEQLQDRAFTEVNGVSNSVMDYVPVNIALKGEKQGSFFRGAIGPYDYWAIEYAYSQHEPAREAQELAKIAARSTDPKLAYGDDADAGFGDMAMDPLASRFDLTDDPLSYFRKRLKLSQELWDRVQARGAQPGDDPLRQRRAIMSGFGPLPSMADLVAKYVGGMHAVRDLPGSGRPAFTPVDPKKQREALDFLANGIFSAGNFKFPPQLLSSLTVDYNEWDRGGPPDIASAVARVQFTALNRLMSAGTASRLLDLPAFVPASQQKGLISLNEVYETLQRSIWSELNTGGDIDRLRRNLQREHVRRLQYQLTRGAPGMPADAASLLRFNAGKLEAQLRRAVARGQGSVETRAHLEESLGMLSEALRAKMQRG